VTNRLHFPIHAVSKRVPADLTAELAVNFVPRALRREAGSALVELALGMPLMVLILIGAAELGRVAYYSIEVSSAAYAGATFGAQNHGTAADTTDISAAAVQDAANVPSLNTATAVSCICSDGTTISCANAATNCVAPARISEFVQVNTSTTLAPMFDYPGISASWPLHGTAAMRVEQ
jgi:Flp pilus assembly protein TadG